ncbi:NAD(+) kinase [Linnemannia zychae]|nr:NAD(+) kinase [Linnemannia zychae]
MAFQLKFTHGSNSVHVLVPDLKPPTIYDRFSAEFPDAFTSSSPTTTTASTLRWLDSDGDWIEIKRDDKDSESILVKVANANGIIHFQSGFTSRTDQPTTELSTLMHRYEKVMDSFDNLSLTVVKLPPITNILIVTKPDSKLAKLTKELSVYLLETFPAITLFVDKRLQEKLSFKYQEIIDQNPNWKDRLLFWAADLPCCKNRPIHLAITLGGDGTVLYTAWLFQQRVPPIVAFHLGSLGFLTNFSFESYKPTMTNIIGGEGMNLNLRMRLQCSVYKYEDEPAIMPLLEKPSAIKPLDAPHSPSSSANVEDEDEDDKNESLRQSIEDIQRAEIMRRVKILDSKYGTEVADLAVCHERGRTLLSRPSRPLNQHRVGVNEGENFKPKDMWQVLNEVTVDRGSNAGMVQLELFVDGNHVTTILADGLVIATATGSTAYSLSIGGSLIHPEKNSVIVSPIASHSLTARPMIIPGTKHLRVCGRCSSVS